MPEMKAMEFTDKLNLQPVTRPVPEPKARQILIQVYTTGETTTEKLWYTTSHMRMARHDRKCQRKPTVDILSPQPGLLRDFTNSRADPCFRHPFVKPAFVPEGLFLV